MNFFKKKPEENPWAKMRREQGEKIDSIIKGNNYVMGVWNEHPIAYGRYYQYRWFTSETFDDIMTEYYYVDKKVGATFYYEFGECKIMDLYVLFDMWLKRRELSTG